MARARGANAILALAYASSYGAVPGSGFQKLPFVTVELGEEQGLIESDLLGYGREPQQPGQDVINNDGNIVVPVELRSFGYWLKMLFGAPTTSTGVAATGSIVFSAQPASNSTVTINGTTITFVSATPSAGQVKIGATLADTLANLVVALNASADANISPASYALDLAGTTLQITHDTLGTSGNSFSLAASSSPDSKGTVSASTLTGGSASGAKNHVFASGAQSLPDAAIEIGLPEVPSYAMNYGVMVNTLAIALQRSGHLNATLGLIAQGEARAASSGAGSLTELVLERFSQFTGQIYRDGVPLGEIVSGSLNFSNGLDKVEVIRQDGRIAGIDSGMITAGAEIVSRFSNTTLLDLATNKTPVELAFQWRIATGKSLRFVLHQVYLPKPKIPVSGPGGIQATFAAQASEHPTLARSVTATLVNDVTSY